MKERWERRKQKKEEEEEEGFRQRTEIKNQNGLHSIPCETSTKEWSSLQIFYATVLDCNAILPVTAVLRLVRFGCLKQISALCSYFSLPPLPPPPPSAAAFIEFFLMITHWPSSGFPCVHSTLRDAFFQQSFIAHLSTLLIFNLFFKLTPNECPFIPGTVMTELTFWLWNVPLRMLLFKCVVQ